MNGQVDIIFLIGLTLKLSILLVEFSLGLRTGFEDILHLFRHPALFVRSLAAMYLVVPFFALSAALAFPLNGPVKIALVALALSPVPPLLPKKQLKAGGGRSYIASLLFTAALISIVFVPVVLSLLTSVFSVGLEISPLALARFVFLMILAPILAGMLTKKLAPIFSAKLAGPLAKISLLTLILAVLPVLFVAWPLILSLIGNGSILVFIAFTLVGLAAGHWLGGPAKETRTTLALAAASRHPGMALVIAGANFPAEKKLVLAALLLYLIVGAVVSLPYLFRKKPTEG